MIETKFITYQEFLDNYKHNEFVVGYDKDEYVVMVTREGNVRLYLYISDFPYYFCVRLKDVHENKQVFSSLKKARLIDRYEIEGDYVKLFVKTTARYATRDNRDAVLDYLGSHRIQTYEADLSPYQRMLVDLKLTVATKYKTLFFDIETDDRGKGIVIGARRIVSIGAVDDEGKEFYWTGEEDEILRCFFRKLEHYDLLTGWNSEKFDIPYVKARAKLLKGKVPWYNWRQTVQVDMMQKMMEIHKRNVELIKEVRSFSLNSIAKHFLNESKVDHTETIWELFTKNPAKLKEYNMQDCRLLLKLEKKLKIIEQKIAEHSISGCFLNEFAVSRILDTYILRNSVGSGVRFKSKPPREETDFNPNKKAGYVGGLVLDPDKGLHFDVLHFDFTSLYPSIIQTFNISPETWLRARKKNEPKTKEYLFSPNDQVFSRKQGIVPKIITDLLKARNDIRYNELKNYKEGSLEYEAAYFKQYAFKTIANSFYGILGASFTRYYRKETAEAITLSGHFLLGLVKRWCSIHRFKVIYGDTDSVFVTSETGEHDEPGEIAEKINHYINYYLLKHMGIVDSQIDLKVEATYDSFLMVGKKKYVKNEGGKLKVSGLEAKRRETLPLTAKKQVEMIEMLMLKKATQKDIINWLLKLKKHVMDGKLKREETILQVKLSKHVDEYRKVVKDKKTKEKILDENGKEQYEPSALAHVKVAVWLQERGIKEDGRNTWEKGSYVKYIITDGTGKLQASSIYDEEAKYDPTYYWDVKIYAPLYRVLKVVFPDYDWGQFFASPKVYKKILRAEEKEELKNQ